MKLDELDIPAWVQRAWDRPFSKDDVLFRFLNAAEGGQDDWETNAWTEGATDYAYAEGYRLAGRIIADHVIQNRWDADFLVYPIVFVYRHYIELQLKRLIPQAAFLANHPLSEAHRKLLSTSHILVQLWGVIEPILQELAAAGASVTPADIEATASYIGQIHALDAGSDSFRYTTTKSGAPSIDKAKLPYINIGVLADGMERLTAYLFGLGAEFREAIQAKCEMEAEAYAEEVRCMEYYGDY
jgi:hypothetical protein